jgi:basic amino acid/polyamine antiporter, APA family
MMAEETVVFARKASGLVRELSWFDVLLITIAGPAASGMTYYTVKIPGLYPGGNTVLAFLLGGVLWFFPVVLIAVFASSFPRSGAMYVTISRATHPLLGFLPNWLWIISSGFSVGFLNYLMLNLIASALQIGGLMGGGKGMSNAGNWVAGSGTRLWLAVVVTLVVWYFELLGMDRLKWFIRIIIYVPLVMTIVSLIIFFVVHGGHAWNNVYGAGVHEKVAALAQSQGIKGATMSMWGGISGMLLAVFWAYTSLEAISFVGSEVKTPRSSFMRGMGFGFFAVMALYILNAWAPGVSFGSTFIRDYSWLYYNHLDALTKVLGTTPSLPSVPFYSGIASGQAWLAILLAFGYLCWYLNTSVIIWMASVRGVFAMAFDRQLPIGLCKVSKRGTPTTATNFIGIFAMIGCLVGFGDAHGTASAEVMLAILDLTGMFFIWVVGLAALFMPFTRPELFEKMTFQYKWGSVPVLSVIGGIVLGIGWYMVQYVGLEIATTYAQIGMAAIVVLGFGIVAFMYNRNRKEGIDPTMIYAQIPPA